MPLRKLDAKRRGIYLKPAASEANLHGYSRPPQTIKLAASASKSTSSFRLHRPSHYLLRQSSAPEEMDLSRPKVPVTITFSVPGTRPPVYVASSLTNPAWEPLEMDLKEERTASGDLVFEKSFDAIESGEYQYKFRLGPGDWWVCDESAPIVSDDAGNRNNLLTVKPPQSPKAERNEASSIHTTSSAPEVVAEGLDTKDALKDGEGSRPSPDADPEPVPFTVVDKVSHTAQPVYDGKRPASLHEDPAKRKADAEPDAEFDSVEAASDHLKSDSQTPASIPAVVVEKTDDEPVHGDDLGEDATMGQQEAHKKRLADAEPDEIILSGDVDVPKELSTVHVVPESNVPAAPAGADDQCPLLPHEKAEPEPDLDEAPLLPHERSASVSSNEHGDDAVTTEFAPVEFDGDIPLFRHESIALSSPDSPPRSPSQSHSRSHTSIKDMVDEDDVDDPSLELFPTRRDTIIEHIQGLASRLEEDTSVPEDSGLSSPLRGDSRSPSSENLQPPSPLDSIQEDEEAEGEEDEQPLPLSHPEPVIDQSAQAAAVGAVPTPPLTPKDDAHHGTRLGRADSVVTVTTQDRTKDDKKTPHDTDGSKDIPRSTESEEFDHTPAPLQPSSASITDVDRPGTSHSTKITPERKHTSFLINFWNSLFGGWLGPVVRWFSRACGGKGRAT
ncbi:hypothetical protein B0J12DRAFT_279639 [Macrophomina phaseolina]|uniref:AMP-activated protein kinase glycogen-binding domain-containing protein n=1 Tax=Macrophomina phaseolina TaxID=35725 RepID=A0ABQ8GMT4_9PEZI|nr:hypothetical protein B0J12DRAFT_279639 [Macrophomina phaseolina]